MKKNSLPILLIAIPLLLIFLAFFNPAYGRFIRRSILIFTAFALPYCLLVKDPRKGLLLFLAEASLLEGPWKVFATGTNLKLLVYIIRDLLLYLTFLNFLIHRKRIIPKDILRQKPPYTGLIFIFLLNIAIQIFNPNNYNYLSAITGARMFFEMVPLYWMGFYLMRDKDNFRIFYKMCILCVFLTSIATVLQSNWGAERVASISRGYHLMVYLWGRGTAVGGIRPPGLGSDMGFTGIYFTQALAMFFLLFIIPKMRLFRDKLLNLICVLVLTVISVAGLIASAQRAPFVQSILVLLIIFLLRKDLLRGKAAKGVMLTAILLSLVIPYMLNVFRTAAQRYETVKTPVALIRTITVIERSRYEQAFVLPVKYSKDFFTGNGLGRVGPGSVLFSGGRVCEINVENAITLSIVELGTIGTILWIMFHVLITKRGFRIYKHMIDFEWKWYATPVLTYMIVVLTFWQFGHLITFPQNAGFWFMAGALMALRYVEHD